MPQEGATTPVPCTPRLLIGVDVADTVERYISELEGHGPVSPAHLAYLAKLAKPRASLPRDEKAVAEETRKTALQRALRGNLTIERKAALECLARPKIGTLAIGDSVEVRDRDGDEWQCGKVISLNPSVKVRYYDKEACSWKACSWKQVRAMCSRAVKRQQHQDQMKSIESRRKSREKDMNAETHTQKTQRHLLSSSKERREHTERLKELAKESRDKGKKEVLDAMRLQEAITVFTSRADNEDVDHDDAKPLDRLERLMQKFDPSSGKQRPRSAPPGTTHRSPEASSPRDWSSLIHTLGVVQPQQVKAFAKKINLPFTGSRADVAERVEHLIWTEGQDRRAPKGKHLRVLKELATPRASNGTETLRKLRMALDKLPPKEERSHSEVLACLKAAHLDLEPSEMVSLPPAVLSKMLSELGLQSKGVEGLTRKGAIERLRHLLWEARALATPNGMQQEIVDRLARPKSPEAHLDTLVQSADPVTLPHKASARPATTDEAWASAMEVVTHGYIQPGRYILRYEDVFDPRLRRTKIFD